MAKQFGLDQGILNKIKNILIRGLALKRTYQVYVFGSRSLGKNKKYSDIDIWIESSPSLTQEELAKIRDEFSESDLPIKVDIVTPETCLPEYKKSILESQQLWFEHSAEIMGV